MMRVLILGPLEVHTPDGLVEIPGRRLRALLIRLALDPGRVVPAERLIDDLWQEEPPAAAHNALQALVSRLRAVVGRSTLESGGGGYRLNLPPEAVDVVLFEQRVRAGRTARESGDAATAAKQLRSALDLWRGTALSDVEGTPFAEVESAGLEEQRVAAVEDLVDAVLAQPAAAAEAEELLPELEQLRAAFPLREKLHARYMRTLYALGRQAEALAAYEQLRQTLADRLGVDPSPELAKLHLALLRQSPDLATLLRESPDLATLLRESPDLATLLRESPDLATLHPATPPGRSAEHPSPASTPHPHQPHTAAPTSISSPTIAPTLTPTPTAESPHPHSPSSPPSPPASPPPPSVSAHPPTQLPTPTPRRGNLPAQLTSFIGRESELEQVDNLLRNTRLVTLTGPGGAGKTRLAQECGARLGELATDGIWFAPLAAVADGADVAQTVLTSLGGENTVLLAEIALERVEPVTPKDRLHALLADRQLILILDNCEHVLDAVAELVDQLLSAAPRVRVLATSREPLALTGETLCPVASLALPPDPAEPPITNTLPRPAPASPSPQADDERPAKIPAEPTITIPPSTTPTPTPAPTIARLSPPPSSSLSPSPTPAPPAAESILEYPSVQLFVERARAVRPGFQLTSANVAPVIHICRALDGIPLAIELAAARLRSLSPQQVADRLDDRFRLLSSGSRTALPRHQTLRAIVDWSWDLLTPAERTVLARLAVFAGGATPDAALHVCGATAPRTYTHTDAAESASSAAAPTTPIPPAGGPDPVANPTPAPAPGPAPAVAPDEIIEAVEVIEIIDVIASLVDKSLVVAQEDEVGEVRYRLLETVRAYAAERLEASGERTFIREAHAGHFVALAERADPELRAVDQIRWINRLSLERDNFNAALRHCVTVGDVRIALRLYQGLFWFWTTRGHEKEGTQWAEEVSELVIRSGAEVPPELGEAYLLCSGVRQVTAAMREHPDDVQAIGSVLLKVVPENSSTARHPALALIRPLTGVFMANWFADSDVTRREFDLLADHPDPWVRAARYTFTALLELRSAKPDIAEKLLLTGYAKFRELGDRQGLLFTLVLLVEFALAKGEFRVAVSRAEEAYGYASDGLNPEPGSMLLIKLGQARACAGEVEHGRRLIEQGLRTAEHSGEFADAVTGRAELAAIAFRQDDRAEARRQLAAASSLIGSNTEKHPDAAMANAMTLSRRGHLAALDGDFDIARDCYAQAAEMVRSGPFLSFIAGLDEIIRGLAALAAMQGDHVRAAELLGSAYAVIGLDNQASYCGPKTKAAALAALGEDAFAEAFDRGRRTHASDVLALDPADPPGDADPT
jgi:predicted ATPase/DNA-binding SARP family transcriptional activator